MNVVNRNAEKHPSGCSDAQIWIRGQFPSSFHSDFGVLAESQAFVSITLLLTQRAHRVNPGAAHRGCENSDSTDHK